MKLNEKLTAIQKALKAPKSQFNAFGKYKYRNCEDILEAVKPLIPAGCLLTLMDELVKIGDRYYVKAIATFRDGEGLMEQVTAYAREEETKKGMDASQITGAASSYARKYCLNGLFLIDDTKDADNMDNAASEKKETKTTTKPPQERSAPQAGDSKVKSDVVSEAQRKRLYAIYKGAGKTDEQVKDYLFQTYNIMTSKEITKENYEAICKWAEMKMDSNMILCPELNYEVTKVDCQNCMSDNTKCQPYQEYLGSRRV